MPEGVFDFARFGKRANLFVKDERSRIGNLPSINDAFPGGILADEILTPGDGQIRAMFITGGNPLLTMANGERLRGATLTARVDEGPWLPPMMLVLGVSADGALDLGALGPGMWTFRVQHPAVGTLSTTREIAGTRPVTVVLSGG